MISRFLDIKSSFVINVIYLLVFAILLTSCQTTKNEMVGPEVLMQSDVQITDATHLVLNDGTFVSLANKEVFLKKKYNELSNVLVIRNVKATPIKDTITNVSKLDYQEKIIPVVDVKEIYVQRTEFNVEGTVFTVLGILAGAVLIFVLAIGIALSNHPPKCCPYIYSFNGSNYVLDAEPLGGAICEGLERTDVSRLENLKSVDGKFKILVKNVNDEQQRIDAMKFVNVKHSSEENVSPDFNRKFYKYKSTVKPITVTNEEGTDITKFFLNNDNVKWLNGLPVDSTGISKNPKETITLKFPKPKNAKNAMLLINGGASYFGSNMIKEVLDLKGNKIDEWYKSIYPDSDEQKKLFYAMHRDETYYMDIKIAEGNALRNTGIMKSNGPMVDEDVLYPVSLQNHNSDFVEIVLTPQRNFWKFDCINIIYDYDEVSSSDIESLDITYAKDNNNNDEIDKLSSADKNYYRMPNRGDKTNILINAPKDFTRETNDIFLETTGWYEINLDKNSVPNEQLIESIYNTENTLYKYGINLFLKSIKDISQTLNVYRTNEN